MKTLINTHENHVYIVEASIKNSNKWSVFTSDVFTGRLYGDIIKKHVDAKLRELRSDPALKILEFRIVMYVPCELGHSSSMENTNEQARIG
jgi:hypothetical protein